ncbi:hypothetical protein Rleg5DRAFT_0621 [Rhizobium leguminosarum bv. viciae WSM1455]|nr:hypothetical protein Rleg5DRAFT_0621 [Rhizobium leguminosarum bv. viciae WSM1455]
MANGSAPHPLANRLIFNRSDTVKPMFLSHRRNGPSGRLDGAIRTKTSSPKRNQELFLLEREPDMSLEMDEPTIVATWENRAQIIEIMSSARTMSQEFQDLWNSSGGTGRLSQENTDRLVELLREIGGLNEKLLRLA